MSDTLTPIAEMTDDDVRREIALRRGWTELRMDGARLCGASPDKDIPISHVYTPDWPRSITAAMGLLEEMIAKHVGEFRLIHRQTFGPEPRFFAGFALNPGEEPSVTARGQTAASAISRAWLAMMREKEASNA